METIKKNIIKLFNDPIYSLIVIKALLRGTWYALVFRLFRSNVRIRLPFKAFSDVTIVGPGSVLIEKGCSSLENVFRGLKIVTTSENATVTIGRHGLLGGLTVRCQDRVVIGDKIMTAVSLIQDSLFVEQGKGTCFNETKPVRIGNNVWLGGYSIVLGGSVIGDDCMVSAGSLCKDIAINDYSLAIGNPVKRAMPIEKVLKLKGGM